MCSSECVETIFFISQLHEGSQWFLHASRLFHALMIAFLMTLGFSPNDTCGFPTLHILTSLHVSLHIHIVQSHTTTTTTTNHFHHHCQPTSSCTHIVLHIHICSILLKEAADRFEMFIRVKRSRSILHPPPPPYNKHNINYC
jgi:hypothetical protein